MLQKIWGGFISFISFFAAILVLVMASSFLGSLYEKAKEDRRGYFYKIDKRLVYCKQSSKDKCGMHLYHCLDGNEYHCSNNVQRYIWGLGKFEDKK